MENSLFQTFLLLAYFDISLIAITIANYAVSASYLGRETRLSRKRMERKRQELTRKLFELHKDPQLGKIKREIKESELEEKRLRRKIFLLSWQGAVILPSIFFICSFAFAVLGLNSEILPSYLQFLQQWIGFSILTIIIGFGLLMITIRTVDSAARSIPLPRFDVRFSTGSKEWKAKAKETEDIEFCVYNEGDDIAESLQILLCFPEGFGVHPHPDYKIIKQDSTSPIPNYDAVVATFDRLYVRANLGILVHLDMPKKVDRYEIRVVIFEKKIGILEDKLVIEITK